MAEMAEMAAAGYGRVWIHAVDRSSASFSVTAPLDSNHSNPSCPPPPALLASRP
ncbi:hypothetical protein EG328_006046 [Venturia inaequalis]|uniref:Uncharacterized protein n=1 Tax=Venturia inaequalis TaxID=5025 RepID=A0A8H3VG52_VENIN|nr:hypothetical protein EG328_006046 [Venturia inaequalis]